MGTSRRSSAADSVREQIKQLILDRQLSPNDSMPSELELCEELGVSRSSVREAVRQLDALDIVDVQHGRGTFVGDLSLAPLVNSVSFRALVDGRQANASLREIVEVRQALDLGHADQVIEALSASQSPQLHELVEAMVAKSSAGDSFTTEDRAFHTALLQGTTRNELMGHLMGAFWDIHTTLISRLDIAAPEDLADTAQAHGAMLRAAEAGDHDAYCAAVRAHYQPLLRVLDRTAQPARVGDRVSAGRSFG